MKWKIFGLTLVLRLLVINMSLLFGLEKNSFRYRGESGKRVTINLWEKVGEVLEKIELKKKMIIIINCKLYK